MVVSQFLLPIPATPTVKLPFINSFSRQHTAILKEQQTTPTGLSISNSSSASQSTTIFPPLDQSVAAIVFGDGTKSRLYPLTKRRSEGAIPIAANYRLIDIVVSNCINSNITKIYAVTQFNSTSLNSHLARAYSGVGLGKGGFVEALAAYQSPEEQDWFQGNADAVRRCLWVLEEHPVREFLVLPGHHLYRMDYQKLMQTHRSTDADITIAVSNPARNHDAGFGFLKINSQNQVLEFREKRDKELENPMEIQVENSRKLMEDVYHIGSMGICAIKRDVMIKLLTEYFPKANNFESEVISGAISKGMKVQSYMYDGYWEDMGTVEAFYQSNMDSTKKTRSAFNFYDRDNPIYTLPRYLPPTTITDAVITDSIIGDGCIFNRCKIRGSVIGMRTWIGEGAVIEDSVLMGTDIYEADNILRSRTQTRGLEIPIGTGEKSYIRKAIVDKNARIGKGVRIENIDNVQEADREAFGYIISGGIVVVLRSAVIPDGSIL